MDENQDNFLTVNEKPEDFLVINEVNEVNEVNEANEVNEVNEHFTGEASNDFMNEKAMDSEFEIGLFKSLL